MVVASAVEPLFQPALPMRGVTMGRVRDKVWELISTRTPHAGSDHDRTVVSATHGLFQPALPMRGVTAP